MPTQTPNESDPRALRVLITNNTLAQRGGTELYTRDICKALLRRGHLPIVYSPLHGELAGEIRALGAAIVDDVNSIATPPDLIHGQHYIPAMTALVRFPDAPAVFFCHGWIPWQEQPPRFPRIHRYVAVNLCTLERLRTENGIPPERIALIHNFADTERFPQRPPLPATPRRALLFSNSAGKHAAKTIARACAKIDVTLDTMGMPTGAPHATPETLLADYDLVFAQGRSAIEALVTGAALIPCNDRCCGPLIQPHNLKEARDHNFALRWLDRPLSTETILDAIRHYDPEECLAVTRQMRATANLDAAADQILDVYRDALADHAENGASITDLQERCALADYLRWLEAPLREWREIHGATLQSHDSLKRELAATRDERHRCERELRALRANPMTPPETAPARAQDPTLHPRGTRRLAAFLARFSDRHRAREGRDHTPPSTPR